MGSFGHDKALGVLYLAGQLVEYSAASVHKSMRKPCDRCKLLRADGKPS